MTLAPWQAAEADTCEAKAECIELALERLHMLDGLFEGERQHTHRQCIEALEMDASNYRSRARKIRDSEKPKEHDAWTRETRTN